MIGSALDRKLWRDLWQARGQAAAIAAVIAAGITTYVMMFAAFESLDLSLATYYEQYRFADVFAALQRAPIGLESQLATVPGVARVETRIEADGTMDLPGASQPVGAHLIAIPETPQPRLNDVYI